MDGHIVDIFYDGVFISGTCGLYYFLRGCHVKCKSNGCLFDFQTIVNEGPKIHLYRLNLIYLDQKKKKMGIYAPRAKHEGQKCTFTQIKKKPNSHSTQTNEIESISERKHQKVI